MTLGDLQQQTDGARRLLSKIILRAALDWVMNRGSVDLWRKELADDAFAWLFLEMPGTREWEERVQDGCELTSFLGICSILGLHPETIRFGVTRMTPAQVLNLGKSPSRSETWELGAVAPLCHTSVDRYLSPVDSYDSMELMDDGDPIDSEDTLYADMDEFSSDDILR